MQLLSINQYLQCHFLSCAVTRRKPIIIYKEMYRIYSSIDDSMVVLVYPTVYPDLHGLK